MNNIWKKGYYLWQLTFRQKGFSKKNLAGYALGLWCGLSISLRYIKFSGGLKIGLLDASILLLNDQISISLLLCVFLILLTDAPFVDSATYYVLIRSNGLVWRGSMIVYLLSQQMVYFGIVLFGCIFPLIIRGNLTSGWSEVITILMKVLPYQQMQKYDIPALSYGIVLLGNIWCVFLHSLLLVNNYFFMLGILVFVGNLNLNFPLGSLMAIGVHFLGLLFLSGFVPLFWPSMIGHSILQYHLPGTGDFTAVQSYMLFIGIDFVLLLILKHISKHTNFNIAVSEREW